MGLYLDERNWAAFRERALSMDKMSAMGDLESKLDKIYALMQKMLTTTRVQTLEASITALRYFFKEVYWRTGMSATASNFIVSTEEDTDDDRL